MKLKRESKVNTSYNKSALKQLTIHNVYFVSV